MSNTCNKPIFDPKKKLTDPSGLLGHCGLPAGHKDPATCMLNVETKKNYPVVPVSGPGSVPIPGEPDWYKFLHEREPLAPDEPRDYDEWKPDRSLGYVDVFDGVL